MATATATLYPSSLAAWAIEAYQRFISPYKGFRCAHRAVHGRDSCSQFAKRVALKRGILALFPLLRRRFTECGVAAQVLDYEARERVRVRTDEDDARKSSWRDSCDCSPSVPDVADCVASPLSRLSPADCTPDTAIADCAPSVDCGSAADCGGADCGGCDLPLP